MSHSLFSTCHILWAYERTLDRGLYVGRVVLCTSIFWALISICQSYLLPPEVKMCVLYVLSSWVPGFGSPMQLLKGEVHRFRRMAVYVRDDFSAYKQCSYE